MRYPFNLHPSLLFFLTITATTQSLANLPINSDNSAAQQATRAAKKPTKPADTTTPQSTTTPAPTSATETLFNTYTFDKNNFYGNVTLLYAIMDGGGLNGTPFAQVETASGKTTNNLPNSKPNFAYQLTLGYYLDRVAENALDARFTNISTPQQKMITGPAGSTIYNELTQLGNLLTANTGFSELSGPGNVAVQTKLGFQSLDFTNISPYSGSGETETGLRFYKALGMNFTHLNKGLSAQYNGYYPEAPTNSITDSINYNADYYAIGLDIELWGVAQLTKKLSIRGGGKGGLLAGFYSSSLTETGHATSPITIGGATSTNFSAQEMHTTQSWTPLIVEVELSFLYEIMKKNNKKMGLSIEGGAASEYIIPTFADDSYGAELGQILAKLNNNLSITYGFIRLNVDMD